MGRVHPGIHAGGAMTAPVIPINGKSRPAKGATAAAKKAKTDWQAVERDYRTGQFTLRELGTKHHCDPALVHRNAKKKGWSQDLALAIKQATDAALVEQIVNKDVVGSQQKVNNTIQAAAEVNKGVILGHRKDIAQVRDLAMGLASELSTVSLKQDDMEAIFGRLTSEMSEKQLSFARKAFNDLMKLPNRIMGAKALAEAITKLQALERTAFSLDVAPDQEAKNSPLARMTDAERAVRLVDMMQRQQKAA
jgi:hypothetical protein